MARFWSPIKPPAGTWVWRDSSDWNIPPEWPADDGRGSVRFFGHANNELRELRQIRLRRQCRSHLTGTAYRRSRFARLRHRYHGRKTAGRKRGREYADGLQHASPAHRAGNHQRAWDSAHLTGRFRNGEWETDHPQGEPGQWPVCLLHPHQWNGHRLAERNRD